MTHFFAPMAAGSGNKTPGIQFGERAQVLAGMDLARRCGRAMRSRSGKKMPIANAHTNQLSAHGFPVAALGCTHGPRTARGAHKRSQPGWMKPRRPLHPAVVEDTAKRGSRMNKSASGRKPEGEKVCLERGQGAD